MMRYLALAMMAVALAGCQDPKHFDLVCHVTDTEYREGQEIKETKSDREYRIDLNKSVWCINECKNTQKLTATTDDLKLQDALISQVVVGMPVHDKFEASIERSTGALTDDVYVHFGPGDIDDATDKIGEATGPCTKAPFKPMPKNKF